MSPWDKLLRAREESPEKPKQQEPKAAPKESGVVKPARQPRASKAKQ